MVTIGRGRFWNPEVVVHALKDENPQRVPEILAAIDRVTEAEDPAHPDGVTVHPLRGRAAARAEGPKLVAILPYGWRLSFSVIPPIPPIMERTYRAHAMVRELRFDYDL